jgi:hypothetical protein
MNKLQKIMDLCGYEVSVTINQNRSYYETVEDYLTERDDFDKEDAELVKKMISTNTVIEIQAYPVTPIGFHHIYHYNLDAALDEMLKVLNDDQRCS